MKRATALLTALLATASMGAFAGEDPEGLKDFDRLDKNGDGILSQEEVYEADLDGGFDDIRMKNFDDMNEDGNEGIDREEFENYKNSEE